MKYSVLIFSFLIFIYSMSFSQVNDGYSKDDKQEGGNNKISGKVLMGKMPLPEGRIFLLSRSSNRLKSPTVISEVLGGKFEFNEILSGEYSIFVIPIQEYDFFYFPKYLPTYLGNVYRWELASLSDMKAEHESFDIQLQTYQKSFYGHGKISGKIRSSKSERANKEIPISVLLLNENKVPMDFRLLDGEGTFLFEYLPEGKYYIHPEIYGFDTGNFSVIVKENTSDINFQVYENSIELEEIDNEELKPIVMKNRLKLFIEASNKTPIVCEIIDLSGKIIFKKLYSNSSITINTTQITNGIYLLRARTYSNSVIKTTKVYINNN